MTDWTWRRGPTSESAAVSEGGKRNDSANQAMPPAVRYCGSKYALLGVRSDIGDTRISSRDAVWLNTICLARRLLTLTLAGTIIYVYELQIWV